MNKIILISLILVGFNYSYSSDKIYEDDLDELFEHKSEGLLIEANPIGLITGSFLPSRIGSLTYLFLSGISIQLAPIIGYGEIPGFGSSLAFHYGNERYDKGFRFGPRLTFSNVDVVEFDPSSLNYGGEAKYIFEMYFDFLSYYKITGNWRWHWGLSIGNGISEFGNRSDIGTYISTGGTIRTEVGIGWLFK